MAFRAEIDPNSIWTCPCGYTGPRKSVVSHRNGYKNRPACRQGTGRIRPVDDGQSPPVAPDDSPPEEHAEMPPGGHEDVPAQHPNIYEFLPDLPDGAGNNTDPEEIARWLNQQLHPDAEPSAFDGVDLANLLPAGNGSPPPNGNGHGPPPVDALPPGGDWTIQPPPPNAAPSINRVNVSLPVSIIVYYDWAKNAKGWDVGDRSLSTFITEQLMIHFRHCLNLAIVVVNRTEIEVQQG